MDNLIIFHTKTGERFALSPVFYIHMIQPSIERSLLSYLSAIAACAAANLAIGTRNGEQDT